MVDTPVLGTGALRRVGSSPTEGILKEKHLLLVNRIYYFALLR